MEYKEEDFLQLSGLQHFSFRRRQWALIHIEQQWAENLRTTEGRILHEKAHDASRREKRGIGFLGWIFTSRPSGQSRSCIGYDGRTASLYGR